MSIPVGTCGSERVNGVVKSVRQVLSSNWRCNDEFSKLASDFLAFNIGLTTRSIIVSGRQ